jgi:phospholipid/cholesterol/gamma-HCH transport system substrate-binding protein
VGGTDGGDEVKVAIRKHLRDFLAILFLFTVSIAVSVTILNNQRLTLPKWVPAIGKDFFEFNAEFSNAQAVTPGQGQTVNVAGVKVGEISRVDLKDGKAVLRLRLDEPGLKVHRDAKMLLRPKTGLKDMVVELDPGTKSSPVIEENDTIGVAQTQPDVNLDEVLASLDGDTRTYLQALLSAGAEGLKGRGDDLGDTIREFKPTAAALKKINVALARRKDNIKRSIHNFSLISEELGSKDDQIAKFVVDSNAVLSVLAGQESSIRATLRGLPPALTETRSALGKADTLASELGPTSRALLPAARQLGPTLRSVRPFLKTTTPILRDQIRPLVRAANPLVTELRPTMRDLSASTGDLLTSLTIANRLFDMLAYNPPGNEEGYLFWFSWVNHLGASIFSTGDAHGPIRRGILVANCNALDVIDNVAAVNPALGVVIGLINIVRSSAVCPSGGVK